MKVLMINSVCGIGSTGRICTDIAEELEKEGHECKIAYGRGTVPDGKQKYAVRIGSGLGVKVHAGLARILDRSGFYSRHATKKFLRWIDDYKPDVIHLHNLHGYYLHVGLLFDYLKKTGIPVVWTLHDEWAFTGHAAYCDAIGCERWQTGCFRCPQKEKYPKSIFFDRCRSNYAKKKRAFCGVKKMQIVTPSAWLKGLAERSFLREYDVQVINNGIDPNVFNPTPSDFSARNGLEGKRIVLGVASTWDERKGLGDFIKLSKLLGEERKVVLVGIDEAQRVALPPEILAVGRTDNVRELAEIYTAADVFVNLTYEDVYSMVNLEAQACGTPAITYRTGGATETVPSKNVVERGNMEELLTAITMGGGVIRRRCHSLSRRDGKKLRCRLYKYHERVAGQI